MTHFFYNHFTEIYGRYLLSSVSFMYVASPNIKGGPVKTLRERYSAAVLYSMTRMRKAMPLIRKAGAMLADAKNAGGRLLVYDRTIALSLDCWTRGSGLYDIHIYGYSQKSFSDGDSLILASYETGDPGDIKVARELKAKANTRLVTISPHKSAKKPGPDTALYTFADVAIDNGLTDTGGALDGKGIAGAVLPCSREINFTINWAVQCEYIQRMIELGKPPTLFYLVHFPYFKEIDAVMKKRVATYGY